MSERIWLLATGLVAIALMAATCYALTQPRQDQATNAYYR